MRREFGGIFSFVSAAFSLEYRNRKVMNKTNSGHERHHGESTKKHRPNGGGLHKDWRVRLAVLLMLVAMAVYLLTMDESFGPEPAPDQASPSNVEIPVR